MKVPNQCSVCEHAQFVEYVPRPTDTKGVVDEGFICENCNHWEHYCFWSLALNQKASELDKMRVGTRKFKRKKEKFARSYQTLQIRMSDGKGNH